MTDTRLPWCKAFDTDEETVVSFSGGRTSAYLLRCLLDFHGGKLPDNFQVLFQNTGKEKDETLDFIHEIETRWNVNITWLEFIKPLRKKTPTSRFWLWPDNKRYKIVNYETANRNGRPFEELIEWKGFVPNVVARMCTQHLKVLTMRAYVRQEIGWKEWQSFIGIRYDEPRRWRSEGIDPQFKKEERVLPLRHMRVTEEDVMEYWAKSDFDLQLNQHQGNCDLCFLKATGKREKILKDNPEVADWWIKMEEKTNTTFRKNQTVDLILKRASSNSQLTLIDDGLGECLCTD